jgi:two-component system NtrC family sensor kinase
MQERVTLNGEDPEKNGDHQHKTQYGRLFRRFVLLTVVCSLVPLLLVGWGINIHYTRFAKSRMMDSLQTQLENHRKIVELFLQERTSRLNLIARTHSRDYLSNMVNLTTVFEILNRQDGSFTDVGVINAAGRHLAYIGPYDLMDKKYTEAFWFKEVMEKGIFISDMFMGFRKVPHFIIAVLRKEKEQKWILRATIDTEVFRSLVESVQVGKTGEVLLLNRQGIYQTSPRFSGKIMEKAPFPVGDIHAGAKTYILEDETDTQSQRFPRQIVAQTWLKEPHWLLMIKQNYAEALDAVNHANRITLIFLHISALIILIVTVLITRHMVTVIKKRDLEAEYLNRQFMQASKLASIGELSAGVAHEINNPLAIILTERQILLDVAGQLPDLNLEFKSQFLDSMEQIDSQIQRCKRITHNLLRFSRRTQSVIETVDINEFIGEVVELMEREARTSGIKFFTDLEENLPTLRSDPSQLQQVFLNMITNAMDAHDGMPYGTIRIHTRSDGDNRGVNIGIADSGSGISQENLAKIFDPFFTTKPVGKGTGLGLSICYSIIQRLGGDISVESEAGKGTEFSLFLPLEPPRELKESIMTEAKGQTG